MPLDYSQWALIFEFFMHVRVTLEYPKNFYNYPSLTLLIILMVLSATQKYKKVYINGNQNIYRGNKKDKLFRKWILIIGTVICCIGVIYFSIAISLLHLMFYVTIIIDISTYTDQKNVLNKLCWFLIQIWLFSHINFGGTYFILFSKKNYRLYPINPNMEKSILIPLGIFYLITFIQLLFN